MHFGDNVVSLFLSQAHKGGTLFLIWGPVEENKTMNFSSSPRQLCILKLLTLAIKSYSLSSKENLEAFTDTEELHLAMKR